MKNTKTHLALLVSAALAVGVSPLPLVAGAMDRGSLKLGALPMIPSTR